MKTKYLVLLAVLTSIITTLALVPHFAKGVGEPIVIYRDVEVPQKTLSPEQVIWLARLMQCESGIKASALNPNDLDNTPSYGILQFKPGTYTTFATLYGLASTTDFKNPVGQVAIVTQWLLRGGVDWDHQFPACVAKLGRPSANTGNPS